MDGTFWQQFWELVIGGLSLDPEVFGKVGDSLENRWVVAAVVLLAGLSQAIGQSIVLFANRIKPLRFVLSLVISALIYFVTFIVWVICIWLILHAFGRSSFTLDNVFRGLAVSYAPQLLGFLVAAPYFGMPISVLLSIWTLLAVLVGIESTTNLTSWQAMLAVGVGWLLLQLGQRTIGQPLARLEQWLTSLSAGHQVTMRPTNLEYLLEQQAVQNPPRFQTDVIDEVGNQAAPGQSPTSRRLYRYLAIAFVSFLIVGVITTSQRGFQLWFRALDDTVRLVIDLTVLGLLGVVVAILMTPLESLSWWAGWQGDRPLNPGIAVRHPDQTDEDVVRYVTYLDGINQGTYGYLPEVERFLEQLAEALPPNVLLVKGIIPYSVSNTQLTADNPFAWVWRWVDAFKSTVPVVPIGFVVNIRNIFAVMMSADARYGPIQNRGLAQVLYDSLIYHGYQPGSGTPISLIGFSGGGQMSMGCVRYLQQVTEAPIEVISIAGVISGNTGAMAVDKLYHLAGDLDPVEKLGVKLFPARWPIAPLSNWNKAKRRGRIVFISLGEIGHSGANGPMSIGRQLPDGRTPLQQTVDITTGILLKDWVRSGLQKSDFMRPSNYELYQAAAFNRVEYYPLHKVPDLARYRPLGDWMGRLILPSAEERQTPRKVGFEVSYAPAAHAHLIGQTVALRWHDDVDTQAYVQLVTMDVHFAEQVAVSSRQGTVHPDRLNHWAKVDPLESIAGAHPIDDITVVLPASVEVLEVADQSPTLRIKSDPVHTTGRFYGLVQIEAAVGNDRFRVRHYDKATQQFSGPEEIVYIPAVLPNRDDLYQSTNRDIEQSPLNETGWYIYGALNDQDEFVVQAIAPFHLFDLTPDIVLTDPKASLRYINNEYWQDARQRKGQVVNSLLLPQVPSTDARLMVDDLWREGDRALLMEVYGGIGGNKKEFAPGGIYFGHFSFGIATVVREPLTGLLRFDIEYRQIFTHSPEGVVAGSNHWTRFMGDRQYGRVGFRPVADVIIKFPPFTEDYDFDGVKFSPMTRLIRELDVMAARYRIGDGTGTTMVSPVNSCVQDSTQALITALNRLVAEFRLNPLMLKWLREHPDHEQTHRIRLLFDLLKSLESALQPLGFARADWRTGELTLGRFAGETPGKTVMKALASWRSLLPRLANDMIAMIFLQLGATVWITQAYQIGGDDPDIEPIAPTNFSAKVPKIKRVRKLKL
ncbi:peptidase [Leptolyngbya iicbica LK]|uniref:Peptidase n=3 Tax=Cyanophyceae TaxID=3028117 RepID=A0A4V2E1U4_9CYAN|nr:peptidase [Leptolyngbya sp. LK]